MKKFFSFCLAFVMGLLCMSCAKQTVVQSKKSAVFYFSCTGSTKKVAQEIANYVKADVFEIEPQTPYTQKDLDYKKSTSRVSKENKNKKILPKVKEIKYDVSKYDVIYVGYPIWFGEAPAVVRSFLNKSKFPNKTIVPFATSHSSGIGKSDVNLHKYLRNVKWEKGLNFPYNATKEEVIKKLETIEFK